MLKQLAPYIGPVLALAIVVWRLSRQQGGRPVKPSRLWIRPAMLTLFLVLAFLHPPALTPLTLVVFAAVIAVGVVLGYVLASHQKLSLDPATGKITSKMSPIGIALFVALFAARYAFRIVATGGQAPDKLMAHSDQIMFYTDAGLLFVLALVSAQAWEIWRRTRPMLDEHAAKKAEIQAE
jgi:hypothetical protein